MIDELHQKKKQLRKEITARVRAMTAEERAAASETIANRVLALSAYREAQSVFLYLSMPTEPDTRALLSDALNSGKRVYVPKCVGEHDMLAVRIRSLDALSAGAYGILEPIDCSEKVEADALDLILVPCVAASSDGKRLGHGKGYYDRFLERGADKTVCLCFSAAICEEIPTEATDVKMHRVVTDASSVKKEEL